MALLMLFMQVFGIASGPQPGLEGHISPDPVDAEGYMVLLVSKNGSLTQEVSAIDGTMGFYCEDRETLPPSLPGSSIDLRPVPLHASSC